MGPEYAVAERRVLFRYGSAAAVVFGAAALRFVLQPAMGAAPPYITFYLAVAAAAGIGGFGPGIFATVLGGAMGIGIALAPEHRLNLDTAAEQIRLSLYVLSGILISWIAGRMHWARHQSAVEAQELRQLSDELRVANEKLLESDRSKDRFVSVVAHELRNPLAPLDLGVQVLRAHGDDPQTVQKTADMFARQVGQMSRIVNDLFDATRIRHNRLDLRRSRVDFRDVVANVVDDHRQQFLARSIGLHQRRPSQPVPVFADAGRLAQAVGNLLHNALKFTPERGDVYVDLERQGDAALLRVRDTGAGMPAELLPRIFEPFEQGEQGPTHAQGGLGLGLALVRTIVELHGGTVQARSGGRGEGAEFVVTLPVDTMPDLDAPATAPANHVGHPVPAPTDGNVAEPPGER